MNNNTLTLKEISKQSFDTLVKSGYSPKYTDDEHIKFDCNIGGVKFSFYPFEDEGVFEYSAAFCLKEKLSSADIERLGHFKVEPDKDYVIFEYFNKVGEFAYLSDLFNVHSYPLDYLEKVIKVLTNSKEIAELKSKSCLWEEN